MSSANGSRSTATVREIFDFWQWWTEKPHAKLTHDRRQKIQSRLTEGYSAQVIIRAILGCCTNPFNRGENDRSREYVDLTLICRNGSKLEGYADAFPENDVEREIARFRAERTQGADGRQLRQDGEA